MSWEKERCLQRGGGSGRMSRVGQFGQISEINDHLCLSGAGVIKPEKIKERGITCIVNATTEEPPVHIAGVDYLKVRVDDNPQANLDLYFDMVADKIKQVRDHGGKTLVHCVAGVSRSATLCIIYLLKYQRMTLRQAYFHVKSVRTIIHPNPGFWRQMIAYEQRLVGRNTVRLKPISEGGDIPDVYSETRRAPVPALSFRSPSLAKTVPMEQSRHTGSPRARASSAKASLPSGLSPRSGQPTHQQSMQRGSSSWTPGRSGQHYRGLNNNASPLPRPRTTRAKPSNFFSSLYDSHTAILFPNF